MADNKKISDLTENPVINGSEEIAEERGGSNYKNTLQDVKTFVKDGLNTSEVAETTDKKYVTDAEKVVIGNTSGTNTGDETTATIQSKRPIKTVNSQSLEGSGNLDVGGVSNVIESNNITFTNTTGDYFGKEATPRTGTLTFDQTGFVTGGISVVYYNNATLDIPITPLFTNGSFVANELNKLYIELDADGNYTLNILNAGTPIIKNYYFSPNSTDMVYGDLLGYSDITSGQYIEFKVRFQDVAKQSPILGLGTSNNSYLTQYLSGQTLMRSISTSAGVVSTGAVTNNTWTVWRLTNTGTDLTLDVDGVSVTGIDVTALPEINQLFLRGVRTNITDNYWADCDFEYFDYNGDKLEFTNTTINHTSNGGGFSLSLASVNPVDLSTLFTEI